MDNGKHVHIVEVVTSACAMEECRGLALPSKYLIC